MWPALVLDMAVGTVDQHLLIFGSSVSHFRPLSDMACPRRPANDWEGIHHLAPLTQPPEVRLPILLLSIGHDSGAEADAGYTDSDTESWEIHSSQSNYHLWLLARQIKNPKHSRKTPPHTAGLCQTSDGTTMTVGLSDSIANDGGPFKCRIRLGLKMAPARSLLLILSYRWSFDV